MTASQQDRMDRFRARQIAEERNLFGRISGAAQSSRSQAKRFLRTVGSLSITEWRVLWDLAEAGPLTVTEMSTIQRTDHALISRTIPAMIKKGYVVTATGEQDRRTSLVAITPSGKSVFEETSATMAYRRTALREAFTDAELDTFLALIERFEGVVEQAVPTGSKVDDIA